MNNVEDKVAGKIISVLNNGLDDISESNLQKLSTFRRMAVSKRKKTKIEIMKEHYKNIYCYMNKHAIVSSFAMCLGLFLFINTDYDNPKDSLFFTEYDMSNLIETEGRLDESSLNINDFIEKEISDENII